MWVAPMILAGIASAIPVAAPAQDNSTSVVTASAAPAAAQPIPIAKLPPEAREARRQFPSRCESKPINAPIENGADFFTFLPDEGRYGSFAYCIGPEQLAVTFAIEEPVDALSFLAYRQFEPLWPMALERWGSDLAIMREEMRSEAGTYPPEGLQVMLKNRTAKVVTKANILSVAGDYDQAMHLVDGMLVELFGEKLLRKKAYDFDRSHVVNLKAKLLLYLGSEREAISYYESMTPRLGQDEEFLVNIQINHAAFLAEAERFEDAYALLEPIYSKFREDSGLGGRKYQIPGSDRKFAWILGCSLERMGRSDEARPYLMLLDSSSEHPRDQHLPSTRASSRIRMRAALCRNNSDAYYKNFLQPGMDSPMRSEWLFLQPAYRDLHAPRQEWQIPATVQEKFDKLYRVLPDELTPALNSWRNDAADE